MAKPNLELLAAKVAEAKAPAPEPVPVPSEPAPTQDSLPKLGPVLEPMARTFAPAPAAHTLSPAQRAAATRAANKGGSGAPHQPARLVTVPTTRPMALRLGVGEDRIIVTAHWVNDAGAIIPAAEVAWQDRGVLGVMLEAFVGQDGELTGYRCAKTVSGELTLSQLEGVIPVVRQIDRALEVSFAESDDDSFACAVGTLAAHFLVVAIQVQEGAEERIVKRGAGYITAHKLGEALQARTAAKISKAA